MRVGPDAVGRRRTPPAGSAPAATAMIRRNTWLGENVARDSSARNAKASAEGGSSMNARHWFRLSRNGSMVSADRATSWVEPSHAALASWRVYSSSTA